MRFSPAGADGITVIDNQPASSGMKVGRSNARIGGAMLLVLAAALGAKSVDRVELNVRYWDSLMGWAMAVLGRYLPRSERPQMSARTSRAAGNVHFAFRSRPRPNFVLTAWKDPPWFPSR
jgi:hypothetical protein